MLRHPPFCVEVLCAVLALRFASADAGTTLGAGYSAGRGVSTEPNGTVGQDDHYRGAHGNLEELLSGGRQSYL